MAASGFYPAGRFACVFVFVQICDGDIRTFSGGAEIREMLETVMVDGDVGSGDTLARGPIALFRDGSACR
ncbi:hypothetical protein, partial [Pseudomonas sp.]|uniref:hypothetical protein n=1 Tax=Pseudomonas sp. TaxID=306 RepID=UPI002583E3B3